MIPFSPVAAVVFAGAFILAGWTIITTLAAYRDKIAAALLFEPIPQDRPATIIRRPR
jgi:hypothetical protein